MDGRISAVLKLGRMPEKSLQERSNPVPATCRVCWELLDAAQYATGFHIQSVHSLAVAQSQHDHQSAVFLEAETVHTQTQLVTVMAAYKRHLQTHLSACSQGRQ
jgi:hypothetical protein